ncbi:MAG: hypothetical protein K2O47_03565 [Muribaculaceae bacterium]|nr:hypothetical protein [Muribaculaceae bacterium]
MRKFILLLVALMPFVVAQADTLSSKELKEIEKDAKKAAKSFETEGWKVLPGALPMQRQLEESYKLQREREGGEPKYIMEDGMVVAQNYNAAKLQAVDAAKLRIAGAMETEIAGLIESSLSNNEISTEDAASISKMASESKSKIAQSLGRVSTVVELFQNLPNKTVRVMVRLAYSSEKAREVAKKVLYKDMEEKSSELKDKLDKMVDW